MSLTAEMIDAIVARAQQHYEAHRAELEATERFKFVCINADTGEYVLGDSRRAAHEAFDGRFGTETPSWITQVGNPNHTRAGEGLF